MIDVTIRIVADRLRDLGWIVVDDESDTLYLAAPGTNRGIIIHGGTFAVLDGDGTVRRYPVDAVWRIAEHLGAAS